MSNFSYSHSVLCPFGELYAILVKFEIFVCTLFQFGIVENLLFENGLTHSHTMTPFDASGKEAF